ncbi:MAG: carbohydrate ABC transporter permease [bacterium]|nr:carbohydrate ABC transporter permease [bacterium]
MELKMNQSSSEKVFNIVNFILISVITAIIIFPLWNIICISFSSSRAIAEGKTLFWPTEFSLENYQGVFADSTIWSAFMISVLRTVIGVVLHTFFCAMMAFAMSKRNLIGRNFYSAIGLITMFFSGGMIPTYLVIKQLGLLNSFWVYVIPHLLGYYDIVILMNFFRQLPDSLEEAAKVDGAGDWRVFLQIALPLSLPAISTIALYQGVFQWNDFMSAKLYVTKQALYPLQMKLYLLLTQSTAVSLQNAGTDVGLTSSRGLNMATVIIATVPIVLIYPFLQKYFISGMMVGAVKE